MVWQPKRRRRDQQSFAQKSTRRRQLLCEQLEGRFLLAADSLMLTASFQDGWNGYQGTSDTSIRGDHPTATFGLRSKLELDGKPDQISLIRWDTTAIPSSSTVTSVSLTFNVIKNSFDGFEVYKALHAWDESTATYQLAATGDPWGAPGATGTTDHSDEVLAALMGPSRGPLTVQLNALGVATVQNWITDPSSNFGIVIQDLSDTSTDDLDLSSSEASDIGLRPRLTITYTETPPGPTVAVETLLTNDLTPALSGRVSNPAATISVTVDGQTKGAVNHGDGTWTLPDGELTALAEGVYDVVVTATASGITGIDGTAGELTIDTTDPVTNIIFQIDCETFYSATWPGSITGTATDTGGGAVDRVDFSIERLSDHQFWSGTDFDSTTEVLLNAIGTTSWSSPFADTNLTDGAYSVTAHATDTAGNVENTAKATFNFDTTPPPAPTVTVDTLVTNDPTPPLSGTVSVPEATVSVTVGGQTKGAVNHGDGTWTLADNELTSLAQGVYNVVVTASAVTIGSDVTTDELTLDTTDPSTKLVFPLEGTRFRIATWEGRVSGTSTDTGGASLDSVSVSIQQLSDNQFWGGSAWDQTSEFLLLATGTTSWSLDFPSAYLADGVSYKVTARASDTAGNIENTETATFAFDSTQPVLTSFIRQAPTVSETSANTLRFRATFNESVRNVSTEDFTVTGTTATATDVNAVNSTTYDLTVSGGDLASLNGTVGLNLAGGQDIADLADNALPGTEPTTDHQYVVVNTAVPIPIVVSFQDGLNGYGGTRDTSLRGDEITKNFGSKSKLELDGLRDQVSLIRWNTSAIPSAGTVIAASLTLNVTNPSSGEYEIYKALRDWDERTATYLLAASGQTWGVPGAAGNTDLASAVLGTVTGPSTGLVTIQLNDSGVAMVQDWITNPSNNFGIVLQDLAGAAADDLDISSREQSRLGPKLTVTYRLGPPPPFNELPQATNDSYGVDEGSPLTISASQGVLFNDTDLEGDILDAIRVSGPSNGTLTLNTNGSFIYTPNANFNGTDSFTYRADDLAYHGSNGLPTNVGTVTISVIAQPDNPTAVNDAITTPKNTRHSFNVLSNDADVDGDSIGVSANTQPSHGSLSLSEGTFTYVPDSNYAGSDSFDYTIRDTTGRTDRATVSIVVTSASSSVVFRVMADIPYSSGEYSELKRDLANVGSTDQFFMHLGDFKSGSAACSSSVYTAMANTLRASTKPVFIVPGDNEWNDCSNPSQAWSLWESNFSHFEENWSDEFQVRHQPQRDENLVFVRDGVLFIGLNLVGGRVHDSREWARRMADNSQWVRENMATYRDEVTAAVVFGHAFPDGARQSFGNAFVDAAKQFDMPVLFMMGNDHNWNLDHPFSGAPNITRVTVDAGAPSVRVTVTQDRNNPFQFDRSP